MPSSLARAGTIAALAVTAGATLWVQAADLPRVPEQALPVPTPTQPPQAAGRFAVLEVTPASTPIARVTLESSQWDVHLPTAEEVLSDLGVVTCEDKIVAFAEVEVRQHGRTTRFRSGLDGRIRGVVDWNAHGVIEVSNGSWRVSAEIADLPRDFELLPPLKLVIHVQSAEGRALGNAQLRLLTAAEGDRVHLPLASAALLATGVSDESGACGWKDISPGLTYLEIRRADYLPALVAVHLRESSRNDREIQLWQTLAARLREVRILDEQGLALGAARVLVGGLYEESATDAAGRAPAFLPWGWMRGTAFELTRELWIQLPSGRWWCPDSSEGRCFSMQDGRLEIRTQDRPLRAESRPDRGSPKSRTWVAVAPAGTSCAFPSLRPDAVGSPAFLGIDWQALEPGGDLSFERGWTGPRADLMGIDGAARSRQRLQGAFHEGAAQVRTWSGTYSCAGDITPPGAPRTPEPPQQPPRRP